MITTAQMYWLTRLDYAKCFFHGITVVLAVLLVLLLVAAVALFICGTVSGNGRYEVFEGFSDEELKATHAQLYRVALGCAQVGAAVFVMSWTSYVLNALTPTTREMAAIIIVPKIANNEKVQDCGNRLYELAIEWMEELKPNKKDK